jgi:hypothetical protein
MLALLLINDMLGAFVIILILAFVMMIFTAFSELFGR